MTMDNSDWVRKRAACSVDAMFERLRGEVQNDVKIRSELNAAEQNLNKRFEFRFDSTGDIFSAIVQHTNFKRSARFSIAAGRSIEVCDRDDKVIIRGTVTICDDGACRIKVGELELEFWQFRRRALEGLFFDLA